MWIVRRRVELLTFCVGLAIFAFGILSLPPPVARTFEVRGEVSNLLVLRGKSESLRFWVGQTEFTASGGLGGWHKLRSKLRDGLSVRVVGWRSVIDGDDGPAGIVELESEAGTVLSRPGQASVMWLAISVLGGLGLLVMGIAVHASRQPRSMAEVIAGAVTGAVRRR